VELLRDPEIVDAGKRFLAEIAKRETRHAHRGLLRKGEARPGERPLGIAVAQGVVRREPILDARPAVILFPWPYRLSDGSRRPLGSRVLLEPGGALLVSLFRAPAPARSLPGRCDISYADPRSLRLALCLRRRVSGRGRDNRLDLCGSGLDRVF